MSREWDSQSYDRLSQPQLGWGTRVINRAAALPPRGDEMVLDAACGTARVTVELAKLFPRGRVVGLDLSENMLRIASGNGEGAVAFVCADLLALPFRPAFDGIFSTAALHWVKDHDLLFRGLCYILKPGGWLIAQCGGGPNIKQVRERAARVQAAFKFKRFFEDWSGPWEFADEVTTANRLCQAGFVNVRTWLEDAYLFLPDAEHYREYLATVTLHQHLARLPDEQLRRAFLDAIVADAELEGRFVMDYWRLNIQAVKPL